jgi:glycosyltransferase involved in cell wall biosynthesis
MDLQVLVIVPAYNEAESIVEVVQSLLSLNYDVLVVDDASTDNTKFLLEQNGINFIRHDKNLGQGAALRSGMLYAKDKSYDIIVHFDADGQHMATDIEKLLQPIKDNLCDVCLGSRFLGISHINMSKQKWLILKVSRYVEFLFTGILLTDVHNGFRAMSFKAFSIMDLSLPRMAHATEIILLIKKYELRYKEVAVKIIYSQKNLKKDQSFWSAFKILYALLKYKLGLATNPTIKYRIKLHL